MSRQRIASKRAGDRTTTWMDRRGARSGPFLPRMSGSFHSTSPPFLTYSASARRSRMRSSGEVCCSIMGQCRASRAEHIEWSGDQREADISLQAKSRLAGGARLTATTGYRVRPSVHKAAGIGIGSSATGGLVGTKTLVDSRMTNTPPRESILHSSVAAPDGATLTGSSCGMVG